MTGRHLANPLAAVLIKAKTALPAKTGIVETYAGRALSGADTVVIADVSGSMAERVRDRRRIDILREALDEALRDLPQARLIAFDNIARDIDGDARLPEPSGSTALHLALAAAFRHKPHRIIVISDGEPDDPSGALAAVMDYAGTINAIYCGNDNNATAIQFMRDLTKRSRGAVVVRDLALGPAALGRDIKRLTGTVHGA